MVRRRKKNTNFTVGKPRARFLDEKQKKMKQKKKKKTMKKMKKKSLGLLKVFF